MFHNAGYLFREGVKSLWKNRTMSIASIGVLISCLVLTGIAGVLTLNLSSMMDNVEGNNSIRVYLETSLSRLNSYQLGDELMAIENISDATFVPKEDALDFMIDTMDTEEGGSLLMALADGNNFMPDAYTITMKDLSKYKETEAQILAIAGVEEVTDYSGIASKLNSLDTLVRYASIGIVAILGLVSLFIISNTIKLTMFSRRMEISIMKSVGATNLFVRVPFIVEGVLIGLIAGGISAAALIFAYDPMVAMVYNIASFFVPVDITPLRGLIILAYLLAGTLFGVVAGGISIGKYLRKSGEATFA